MKSNQKTSLRWLRLLNYQNIVKIKRNYVSTNLVQIVKAINEKRIN